MHANQRKSPPQVMGEGKGDERAAIPMAWHPDDYKPSHKCLIRITQHAR